MSKARELLKKYLKRGYELRGCNDCSGKGLIHYNCHRCKGEGEVVDFCQFELIDPHFHRYQCLLRNGHKGNHKFSKHDTLGLKS